MIRTRTFRLESTGEQFARLFQLLRRIDAEGHVFHHRHVDAHAGIERAQLLELLAPLVGRRRQLDETLERRAPVGVKPDVVIMRPRAGRIGVVVNVQGDLPTLDPAVDIATLAAVIADPAERSNPNVVKVSGSTVAPGRMRAATFTRANATGAGPHYHHIGLYAYRRAALERFVKLPPSANERREKLEQLRALDAGMRIDVVVVDSVPLGVDTPAELKKARKLLAG